MTYPGAFHHSMNRGVNGEAILAGDTHKEAFLQMLAEKTARYRIRLLAYCLMDNHYHLVLQNTSGRMSDFFRNLNTQYGFYYRRAMGGQGYVFQGRFKSTIIENESYLRQVILYVLQNPRRAGIPTGESHYPWSSIGRYFSADDGAEWLDHAFVEGLFANQRTLLSAVNGKLLKELPTRHTQFGGVIGAERFLDQARDRFERRGEAPSDKRRRADDNGFDPIGKVWQEFEYKHQVKAEAIDTRSIQGKRLRGELLVRLRDLAGLTLREINEIPPFTELKYHSMPHLYRIAHRRFYTRK